jgi:hypothetical protein
MRHFPLIFTHIPAIRLGIFRCMACPCQGAPGHFEADVPISSFLYCLELAVSRTSALFFRLPLH